MEAKKRAKRETSASETPEPEKKADVDVPSPTAALAVPPASAAIEPAAATKRYVEAVRSLDLTKSKRSGGPVVKQVLLFAESIEEALFGADLVLRSRLEVNVNAGAGHEFMLYVEVSGRGRDTVLGAVGSTHRPLGYVRTTSGDYPVVVLGPHHCVRSEVVADEAGLVAALEELAREDELFRQRLQDAVLVARDLER